MHGFKIEASKTEVVVYDGENGVNSHKLYKNDVLICITWDNTY